MIENLPHSASSNDTAPLIVFDGVCVLCSAFARTVVRLDTAKQFRFVMAQSVLGEALYRRYGLRTDDYETNIVIIDGVAYTRLDSLIAVASALGWPWRMIGALKILPRRWRDWLYERIARNRYAIFGRKDRCELPSGDIRKRILE